MPEGFLYFFKLRSSNVLVEAKLLFFFFLLCRYFLNETSLYVASTAKKFRNGSFVGTLCD